MRAPVRVIAAGTTSSMAFNYLANPRPVAASGPRSGAIQLSCSAEPVNVVYISLKLLPAALLLLGHTDRLQTPPRTLNPKESSNFDVN